MSANEYYKSAPGQGFQSPDSFWKVDPPASSTNIHSPPLHVPPPKGAHGNGISQDPNFSLTNFPPTYDPTASPTKPIPIPPPRDAIPVPPPNAQPKAHAQSPPAPGSAGSCVTDESDDSLVHIRLPGGNATRSHHRSDSLSLTQSNLQHHNDLSSGMVSSMRDYGLSSNRKRLRGKELATHSKDTLIQMLIRQEHQSDEGRKLLRNALDKLEQYKLDLLEANNHCRRLERACQKLTDERMLMHTQVTEAVGKAQQQALAAQQELSIYKLRLEHAEQALANANADLREARLQREAARTEAEHARNEARRIREESNMREAREQGRKQGFEEGVSQGRILGISQAGSPAPRQITQAGEPTNTSAVNTTANTMDLGANETSIVGDGSSSSRVNRTSSDSPRGQRISRADFEEAVERVRRETEARLQRELDQQLNEERERLKAISLRHEQWEREWLEEREKIKKSVEERERQRAAEIQAETERLKRLEDQMAEERRAVQARLRELEMERERERELREREQRERQREREERERERMKEEERLERERNRVERERERERLAMLERDRERDRAVTEATAQAAAAAAANANATANANTTRPTSETSASGSENERSSLRSYLRTSDSPIPPLPYIPMPRPPFDMPTPMTAQPPVTIPATVSMPEPTVNPIVNTRPSSRSAVQPSLPTTVPARQKRNRRSSIDSQSSMSTVAGTFESLVSFPHAVSGRASSSGSTRAIPGVAGSTGSNGRPPSTSVSRTGMYTRPHMSSGSASTGPYSSLVARDALSDIPEDASVRDLSPDLSSNHSGRGYVPAPVIPPPPVLSVSGAAPSTSSQRGREQPPSWLTNPPPDPTQGQQPVVPSIRVDAEGWRTDERTEPQPDGRHMPTAAQPMNMNYLNPQYQPGGSSNLHRSDSTNSARPSIRSNSSYEFTIEPPSNPTSPTAGRSGETHGQPVQNQYLSPHHATIPIPHVPTQPVLPRRPESPVLPVRITSDPSGRRRSGSMSAGSAAAAGGTDVPTAPSSPAMPPVDAQTLPPGFVPQTFTPHAAASPALPPVSGVASDAGAGLPPGFVPQAVTDTVTGVTTPLAGMSALPSTGAPGPSGGGTASRRQSVYGNPNAPEDAQDGGAGDWGDAGWGNAGTRPGGGIYSPYTSSSPLPTGPPVIPKGTWGDADDTGGAGPSNRTTPSQRPRSIYGSTTPGGSTRTLPANGTPAGGGVYQNPLRQEEGENEDGEGETDELVARNTKINATAPPPITTAREKKKKKGRR